MEELISVAYDQSAKTLTFYDEYIDNSLIIFTDDDGAKHFIRVDSKQNSEGYYDVHVYLDEIYGKTYDSTPFDNDNCECTFNNVIIASNQSSVKFMNKSNLYLKTDKISSLETRIAVLEAENAALKETINNMSSSTPSSQIKYPWQTYEYADFTERIEFININCIGHHIYYTYDSTSHDFNVYYTDVLQYHPNSDFLCIICLPDNTLFVRIATDERYCYINEANNTSYRNEVFRFPDINLSITNSTMDEKRAFDYVFRKSNA